MPRIVVGVDDSPEAAAALRWAIDEARLRRAALVIVHAWSFPLIGELPGGAVDTLTTDLERAAAALLDQVVHRVAGDEPGVDVERRVLEGGAANVLLAAAAGADLLVVGSRGRGDSPNCCSAPWPSSASTTRPARWWSSAPRIHRIRALAGRRSGRSPYRQSTHQPILEGEAKEVQDEARHPDLARARRPISGRIRERYRAAGKGAGRAGRRPHRNERPAVRACGEDGREHHDRHHDDVDDRDADESAVRGNSALIVAAMWPAPLRRAGLAH
jgi:nucleotide-binding universal stress UspA family protein